MRQPVALKDKQVLVTAGPTVEPIDPVRFISNHSTGKMGYAIAKVLAERGAKVFLVSGPVPVTLEHPNVKVFHVTTAKQMHEQCAGLFAGMDIAVMAAAVSDFTPERYEEKKIKDKDKGLVIKLKPTRDIAADLGLVKKNHQVLVGFALESHDEEQNARQKLINKNLDMIVLNSLKDKGAGFGHDTNKVTVFHKNNIMCNFELKSKEEVAVDIVNEIEKLIVH